MYRKIVSIVALAVLFLGLSITPAYAGASIVTTISGGSAYVNANTAYTLSSVVTNTFGVTKNVKLRVFLPIGMYFNGTSTVSSGTLTCVDIALRQRDCTVSIPANTARTFTTPIVTGEGFVSDIVITDVVIDNIGYAFENLDYLLGSGFVPMVWDARWKQTPDVHYTHGTSTYEWTFFDATFATTPRSGKFTFFVQNGEITSIGLCKYNHATDSCTTGWLGSAGWVDGTHQGATITYTGMDNSDYGLLVNFDVPPSAGSSYLQVVYTSYVGANGYRATDVKDTVVID